MTVRPEMAQGHKKLWRTLLFVVLWLGSALALARGMIALGSPPPKAAPSSGSDTKAPPTSTQSPTPMLDERASLSFVRDKKTVKEVTLGEMLRELPAETLTVYDPYYNHEKTFRAVPLRAILKKGFEGKATAKDDYVLKARDGYTVPMRGAQIHEEGAFVAFADTEFPGWEPIGPQRANPGPFYLIWRGKDQQSLETHPRPWQLASIEIAQFEDLFPHTVPNGEPEGSMAMRGFGLFKEHCIHCHAINREGGRVGPDLNVPQSIFEYRPPEQIKAYIRDPLQFRYGTMPAHPFLKDDDLDALLSYFGKMKDQKHDPSKAKGSKK